MEAPTLEDHERSYKLYNMYKRPENLESPLALPRESKNSIYNMNDQTFHTPSFGDEEFDIPLIQGQHAASGPNQGSHIQYTQLHHSVPQVGMMNPAQDGLAPPGGAPSYQQPLYLQEPHTPVTTHSGAGAPAGNYIIQQQPGGQQRLLMMQPTQVAQQVMSGPSTPSTPTQPAGQVYGSPQRASPPGTTSDDSDDSVPSHHSQLPGDAESLLPIHYCSASRQQQTTLHQQMGVSNMAVKRSSPEPMDNGINRGQMQKKPKVQKKKKKRDPNEPQKPVSAYALFFRDTQAAIKGQNPNASFGEVSKIVASMWDGLDSEHKSVYKQKTEVAKKEYLKALAAYRASLVSKGGEQENPAMYNHSNSANPSYGNFYQGQAYGNGHSPQGYSGNPGAPQGYSPQTYPGGQTQPQYAGQSPQGYPPNPQQSPQNYQGNIPLTPQTFQGVPGQSPQNYQVNPNTSPQNCQPNLAQSPRSYQPAQSPNSYPAASGLSPPGYRQVQSQSPPINNVHAMQYHHPQQMSQPHPQMQVHQVQQYQQQQQQMQQQQQHQQQQQQQIQQQQQQIQQQQQQLQHQQQQQQQQQHQQQQQQQHQQHQQQQQQQQQQHQQQQQQVQQHQQTQQHQPPQQHQQPTQQQQQNHIKPDQHSPNSNGSSGIPPQQSSDNENRSTPSCIRQGCTNPAIANSEWEDEYCSNECVVSHCRDVFSSWVASNNSNQIQNFSAVK